MDMMAHTYIQALRNLTQKNCHEFKASLGSIVNKIKYNKACLK